MTNSDEANVNTFGARFGRLVRSYRDDLGLSVRDLAIQVWNDEGRKASISRLENARVANPAARTIQMLAHALDIPQEEIDQLRKPTIDLPSQLNEIFDARRDQLEALATRFEVERVFERSNEELRALLDEKAQEYREYKSRLSELDGPLRELSDMTAAAREAAASLDFQQYETLLRKIDDSCSKMAIRAKAARARNALLRGRVEEAFASFASAAETCSNLDIARSIEIRLDYHRLLFEHGLRHVGTGLERSADILRPALEFDDWEMPRQARVLQNLANALANMGIRSTAPDGVTLLDEAIKRYGEAISLVDAQDASDNWAMIQQNLGAALSLRAKRCSSVAESHAYLDRATQAFDEAVQLRPRERKPLEWAMTTQNIAVVLLEKAGELSGPEGLALLRQAQMLLQDSLSVRMRSAAPFDSALTQENLAIVHKALADRSEPAEATMHLNAAARYIAAALEVYEFEGNSYYHAKASELSSAIGCAKRALSGQSP